MAALEHATKRRTEREYHRGQERDGIRPREGRLETFRRAKREGARHWRCRVHRLPSVREPARRRLGGLRAGRPFDLVHAECRSPEGALGLPSRRRLGALSVRPQRARVQVRRRLPSRRGRRREADRRAPGAHARHERPGHGDGSRVLQPLRQARADRVHLGGVRRSPRAATARRGGATALRPHDGAPVGVRRFQGDGRVPGVGLPPGAGPRLRHRPALQHRRAEAERAVRHGDPTLCRARARGRPARDPRRRHADAVFLPRRRHHSRAERPHGRGELRPDLQRRVAAADQHPGPRQACHGDDPLVVRARLHPLRSGLRAGHSGHASPDAGRGKDPRGDRLGAVARARSHPRRCQHIRTAPVPLPERDLASAP